MLGNVVINRTFIRCISLADVLISDCHVSGN